MKKCYIHIGVHKTGTTSIQNLLGRHRAALRKYGISVPVSGNAWLPEVGYHHNIAFELNNDSRYVPGKGGIKALCRELEQEECPTVVISSEDLCVSVRDAEKVARLRDPITAMGYEIIWVVYFRTYPEWAESAYIELAKALAITRKFEPWVKTEPMSLAVGLDPLGTLAHVRATGDQVIVHSYAQTSGDVTGHFFRQIEAPAHLPGETASKDRANNRLSVFELEFLRNMAVHIMRHIPQDKKNIVKDAVRTSLTKLPKGPSFRGLSDPLARRLYESTRPAYEALLAEYRPGVTVEQFFPLASHYKPVTIDCSSPSAEDRLSLYRGIIQLCMTDKFGVHPDRIQTSEP
jgi:hypothetical protein